MMEMDLRDKVLSIDFPELLVRKYRFQGFDLESETILLNLDICLEAVNAYIDDLWTEMISTQKSSSPKRALKLGEKINKISIVREEIISYLKLNAHKKNSFFITNLAGEKILIDYSKSWEYEGLGALPVSKLESLLLLNSVRLCQKYVTYKANYYINKITKSQDYKNYEKERNVRERKILAYKILTRLQRNFKTKDIVMTLATKLNIEIVKAEDFESYLFKEMRN